MAAEATIVRLDPEETLDAEQAQELGFKPVLEADGAWKKRVQVRRRGDYVQDQKGGIWEEIDGALIRIFQFEAR